MTPDCNSCQHHLQGRTLNDCPDICWSCFDHTQDPLVMKNWTPIYEGKPKPALAAVPKAPTANDAHYATMGVEPWDVLSTWPIEQQIGAYRHGLLKYTMRLGSKDARLKEAEKALAYALKLVEVLKAVSPK